MSNSNENSSGSENSPLRPDHEEVKTPEVLFSEFSKKKNLHINPYGFTIKGTEFIDPEAFAHALNVINKRHPQTLLRNSATS